MKNYDLYRGPYPYHLRTWDEVLNEAYLENWLHDHVKTGPIKFIGKLPLRVDLGIQVTQESVDAIFMGWSSVGMTIRWIRPTLWGRLVWRIKKFLGLFPKGNSEPRLI
jgi:hypothetical protein